VGEASRAISAGERLRAYRGFLAGARARKAQHGSSPLLEAEVLAQARDAQSDLRALGGSALRVVRHLEATGLLAGTLAAVRDALRTGERVSVDDVFADVVGDETARAALANLGLTEATLGAMGDVIAEANLTVEADGASVRVRSPRRDRDVRLASRPRGIPPGSPAALLFDRVFEAAVAQWEQPGWFPFDVFELRPDRPGEPPVSDPLDAVLGAAVASRLEMARHVRKIEDAGLAAYTGRDPASALTVAAILGIAGLVAVAAGGALLAICGLDPNSSPGSRICIAGDLLLAIGIILLVASFVSAVIGFILQTAASASA
jgi:hypothetical protein